MVYLRAEIETLSGGYRYYCVDSKCACFSDAKADCRLPGSRPADVRKMLVRDADGA